MPLTATTDTEIDDESELNEILKTVGDGGSPPSSDTVAARIAAVAVEPRSERPQFGDVGADPIPIVVDDPGAMAPAIREILRALALRAHEHGLYEQGDGLITIRHGAVREMTWPDLLSLSGRVFQIFVPAGKKGRGKAGELIQRDPPRPILDAVLREDLHASGFRPLRGIARGAHVRDDGSVADAAGYDSQSGIVVLDPRPVPRAGTDVAREAYIRIRRRLEGLVTHGSMRAAIGAAITAALVEGAADWLLPPPLIVISGPTRADAERVQRAIVGAAFCDSGVAAVAMPRRARPDSVIRDIDSAIASGARIVSLIVDDDAELSPSALGPFITDAARLIRLRAVSSRYPVPFFIAAGAGLTVGAGLAGHVLAIRTNEATAAAARIDATDAMVVASAWLSSGASLSPETQAQALDEAHAAWSTSVGAAVAWAAELAGESSLAPTADLLSGDEPRSLLHAIVRAVILTAMTPPIDPRAPHALIMDSPSTWPAIMTFSVSDVIRAAYHCSQHEPLPTALSPVCSDGWEPSFEGSRGRPRLSARRLGIWLAKQVRCGEARTLNYDGDDPCATRIREVCDLPAEDRVAVSLTAARRVANVLEFEIALVTSSAADG